MREPPRARQAVRGLKRARARAQLFLAKLTDVLAQHPPPQPSRPAVDLLVAVGQQQEYLLFHNLLPPPGHPGALDALQVFGPHVARWIDGSQAALCGRCRQLEAAAGGVVAHAERLPDGADGARPPRSAPPRWHTAAAVSGVPLATVFARLSPAGARGRAGRTCVAPLVEEMLARIAGEVGRYERVVTYWPVFGPLLEGAVCAALREATGAVSRQCGLGQVGLPALPSATRPPPPPPPTSPRRPTAHGSSRAMALAAHPPQVMSCQAVHWRR